MTFRRFASIYGATATALGLLLIGWGPMFLGYFGSSVHPDLGSYSLVRLSGVGFLLAGGLLLAIRKVIEPALQHRIALAMLVAHMAGGVIVWSQQLAIWGAALGAILTVWLWLAAAVFGVMLIRGRRTGSAAKA